MPTARRLTFLLILLGAAAAPAMAGGQRQDGGGASIEHVDTSSFPDVAALVAVTDAFGMPVAGLPASAFSILEDDAPANDVAVSQALLGVQVAIVLNPGPTFEARDSAGVSRLEYVRQALLAWTEGATAMRDGLDDVSIIAPEGALITHSSRSSEVRQALLAYQSDYSGSASGFPVLSQGLDFVLDPSPRPGMRRVVLFVSSALDAITESQIADVVARAHDADISLYTGYVGPDGSQATVGAQDLQRLAEQSGGAHVYVDSAEALQPILEAMEGWRTQYELTYRSRAATSGSHRLAVRVQTEEQTWLTEPAEFSVSVLPPNITLEALPERVSLATPESSLTVGFAIEFPDGYPRQLSRSVLFVDGQPVAENTAAPFDVFHWDISSPQAAGEHRLQAVAVDELGLQAQSQIVSVTVDSSLPLAVEGGMPPLVRWAAAGLLLLAAIGAILVVVGHHRRTARPLPSAGSTPDPSSGQALPRMVPSSATRRPAMRQSLRGRAFLEVLEGGEGAFEIRSPIVRLGRDASVAQISFADRSVSRLHARLAEIRRGVYHLYDEGSTSGTWVNFEQVPIGGMRLGDGDLIHLGRVQLRFHLPTTGPAPAALATPPAPDQIPTGPTLPVSPVRPGSDDPRD